MIRLVGSISGDVQFDRAFNRVEEQISDFRPLWPSVIKEFYSITSAQFESEGTAGASGKFAPLKPAYAKFKEVHFPGMPILQATGHLFASMTDPEASDAILRPEKDQLTIGTKTPYAIHHQRGTPKMKARKIVSLSEDSKRRIQKAIQRPLVEFVRRQGFQTSGDAS